ncbi:MAG: hydro-lyase, Fe-S type, tartrate/fumarate subfamily, alpha subunit [Clostridia bacterium]|nr:hydro-lyase, Fe-S type, tartrate/fumarate subfamily, alpha subunit [Clostridia bacterium]
MRTINSNQIQQAIKALFIEANYFLSEDVLNRLRKYEQIEASEIGKEMLCKIVENAELAANQKVAICQDTGMSVVFVELGQEVHIEGINITDAINEGVRQAYKDGYLRKSVVMDPLNRVNTNDNTPAVIHYDIVAGDNIKIQAMPKGFGSENMSAIKMLKPSDGVEGIIDFVVETVQKAGANPCPPIIVGIGIGGTMEKAAILSKKSLLRSLDEKNNNPYYTDLENMLLTRINNLGIGPQGLGGITTALAVKIESYPTHMAGLPVAVNITCHASRHKEIVL